MIELLFGINTFGAQWRGDIFTLHYAILEIAVLPHKISRTAFSEFYQLRKLPTDLTTNDKISDAQERN